MRLVALVWWAAIALPTIATADVGDCDAKHASLDPLGYEVACTATLEVRSPRADATIFVDGVAVGTHTAQVRRRLGTVAEVACRAPYHSTPRRRVRWTRWLATLWCRPGSPPSGDARWSDRRRAWRSAKPIPPGVGDPGSTWFARPKTRGARRP